MKHHCVTKAECPRCFYQLDCAFAADASDDPPVPGDFTLCFKCGAILVFTDDLDVRPATDDDLEALEARERKELERAQRLLRAYRRQL